MAAISLSPRVPFAAEVNALDAQVRGDQQLPAPSNLQNRAIIAYAVDDLTVPGPARHAAKPLDELSFRKHKSKSNPTARECGQTVGRMGLTARPQIDGFRAHFLRKCNRFAQIPRSCQRGAICMKNLKKGALVFLALLMAFLITCSKGVAGKYVNQKNKKEYLELRGDGTFFVRESGTGMSGHYRVDGGVITLTLEGGMAAQGKIQGNTITDEDGKIWVEQ
jgi:hypothetical protein